MFISNVTFAKSRDAIREEAMQCLRKQIADISAKQARRMAVLMAFTDRAACTPDQCDQLVRVEEAYWEWDATLLMVQADLEKFGR